MKRILLVFLTFISINAFAQQPFSSAGLRIGGSNTFNWRIYRSGSGSTNQSLLFANVGGTPNAETIRARLTQWGGLSLGGTSINSTDLLSVLGNARIAGNLYLPLMNDQSGVIILKGEATDNAIIRAEKYGTSTGSRLRFQVSDDLNDYFSFMHHHNLQGSKEVFKITRSSVTLEDGEFLIDNVLDNGLKLAQVDGNRFGKVYLNNDSGTGTGTGNTLLLEVGNDYGDIYNQRILFKSANADRMVIEHNGNVGIGTTSPTHKLSVAGTIKSSEVIVEALPWPDYVFATDYDLKSLTEVSQFIVRNGHLPNIPSAKEVESSGIALGKMNASLLEKIEELTLYTIDQETQISSIKLKMVNQESKLKAQESLILSLIERIKKLESSK